MKSIEERLKKAALGAGCLFLALGAFEMQSHAADAASQVQSRALLVTRGDYEGTEYDLTPGPQNDGVNVSRMLQNAYGGQNISITTEEKTKTKSELKKAIQTAFADSDADDVNYFYYSQPLWSVTTQEDSGQTAVDKTEEGGDDVKSSCPL